jgi:hypothetical protein
MTYSGSAPHRRTPPWTCDPRRTASIASCPSVPRPRSWTLGTPTPRIYNYWLGGQDNFAADREAAEQAIAANPGIVADVRANRAFLVRAVRYLAAECGVRQFLDIGAGLPTASNTHEVAQAVAPDARIVYVDHDPLVLVHAQALLSSSPEGRTAYVESDLRDTSAILREPGVVQPQQWRPDPAVISPDQVTAWCGVARKE